MAALLTSPAADTAAGVISDLLGKVADWLEAPLGGGGGTGNGTGTPGGEAPAGLDLGGVISEIFNTTSSPVGQVRRGGAPQRRRGSEGRGAEVGCGLGVWVCGGHLWVRGAWRTLRLVESLASHSHKRRKTLCCVQAATDALSTIEGLLAGLTNGSTSAGDVVNSIVQTLTGGEGSLLAGTDVTSFIPILQARAEQGQGRSGG